MFASIPLVATSAGSGEFDIFGNILDSQGVVLAVLIVLALMSLACWFIIAWKYLWFARQKRASKRFLATYWESSNPAELYDLAKEESNCAEARIFVAGFRELGNLKKRNPKGDLGGFENIERAVRRTRAEEVARLETALQFLATTGSTGPFIGLFGTVWGIMRAFAGLGQMEDTSNLLTTVTPHIAEALVATAIGLAAAIPAVMAYNYYVNRIRRVVVQIDGFGSDFLNTLRRLYFPQ